MQLREPCRAVVKRYQRLLAVALFIVGLLLVVQVTGLRQHFDLASVRGLIEHHPIGGLLLFIIFFALGNFIQIPGSVFFFAAVS